MEQDPALTGYVERHREAVRRHVAMYEAAGRGFASARTMLEAEAFLTLVQEDIQEYVRRHGPSEINPETQYHFLMAKLIPARILARNLVPIEPVTLTIGPDRVIIMLFTTASQRERDQYGPLIALAQDALGYHKDTGGNRPIAEDPAKNEQARTVAKLAWMGLSDKEISGFMGWTANDGRQPLGQGAAEKRVADYLRAGIQILSEDAEDWPSPASVPIVRPPQRAGLGPPWVGGRLEGGAISEKAKKKGVRAG